MKPAPTFHPPHQVHDGLINSGITKQILSIRRPTVEMIRIEDIAGSLAKNCRWGGLIKPHFSVAQHSCLVSYLAPEELRFAALMHDAAEAYLGDVKKPVKVLLGSIYYQMEMSFMEVIGEKFQIRYSDFLRVKEFDIRAADIEFNAFFKDDYRALEKIFNTENSCWPHEVANEMFLSTFNELYLG